MLNATMRKATEIKESLEHINLVTRDAGGNALIVVEFPEDATCVTEQLLERNRFAKVDEKSQCGIRAFEDKRGRHGKVVVSPAYHLAALAAHSWVFQLVVLLECPYVNRAELMTLLGMCDEYKCRIISAATNHIGWITLPSSKRREEDDE